MTALLSSDTEVKTTTRTIKFVLDGKTTPLHDPNPSLTAEGIRQHYVGLHPEMLNAKVTSETDADGNETLTFGTQVARKG